MSRDTMDGETQKVAFTIPKIIGFAVLSSGMVFGAGVGYSQLATVSSVDKKVSKLDAKLLKIAEAQAKTAEQMNTMASANQASDKSLRTLAKLVKIQFVEQVDNQARRRPRKRSAKSEYAAKVLNVNPDNPLEGIELLEAKYE